MAFDPTTGTNKSSGAARPRDLVTGQAGPGAQKPIPPGNPAQAARTPFATDDVTGGSHAGTVGSVGNGAKPFRLGGG